MKLKEIRNLSVDDANRMTKEQLREAIQKLARGANKTMKEMQAGNFTTPALRAAEKSGGKFTIRGKNKGQLVKEFARLKRFTNPTGTGSVEAAKEITAKFNDIVGTPIETENENEQFWNVYNELAKKMPDMISRYGSKEVMRLTRLEVNKALTTEDVLNNTMQRLKKMYEDMTENEPEDNDDGEFTTEDYF